MGSGETLLWLLEHLLYSSFTALGVCRALSLTCSHLFPIAALVHQFSTFLENVIPEACQHCHLARFGWQRVCLGVASVRYGGSFQHLLTEATPAAPLLPKPGLSNPINYMLQERRHRSQHPDTRARVSKPFEQQLG